VLREDEINRLRDERRHKAHLLGTVRCYFELYAVVKDLEQSVADTNRLIWCGSRDLGRVLRK
jgi:protein regulator of cytokinesis 1